MNLASVGSRNTDNGVFSVLNQSENSPLFTKGNTFRATILGRNNNNNFLLETFNNIKFETSITSMNPSIGEKLDFEVVSAENGNVSLKLLNTLTPTSTRGSVNQIGSQDVKEIFKQSNANPKEDNIATVDANDAALLQKEENLKIAQAVARIRSQASFTSDNLSLTAVNELLASGLSMDKINMTLLNSVLQEIQADPSIEVPPAEMEAILQQHEQEDAQEAANEVAAKVEPYKANKEVKESARETLQKTRKARRAGKEHRKDIISELSSFKIPTTGKNVKSVERAIISFYDIADNMDDGTIIHALKDNKAVNLDDLYKAKHSSGGNFAYKELMDDNTWSSLSSEVDRIFSNENIENTPENLKVARMLISNEIPVSSTNMELVSFLKGLRKNTDMRNFISEAVNNIRRDFPITYIDLNKTIHNKKSQELNASYKNLLTDLPNLTPDLASVVEDKNKPVTLQNMREEFHNPTVADRELFLAERDLYLNERMASLPNRAYINKITHRRELAEIQLKLTSEAAFRLASKSIDVNTMLLSSAVNELRVLEHEAYGRTLLSMGAPASIQNIDRMSNLFNSIEEFKPLSNKVFSDIITHETKFTIDGISKSNLLAKALDAYEAAAMLPNAKYGDSFEQVYAQIPSVVKGLGLTPTEENIRAASILSRNRMDVTPENLAQVQVIDQKISYVQNNMHPHIAASLIKDGYNPLNMHVDEVISYIDSFNNEYGTDLKDKIAEHILEGDAQKNLTQQDRDSMIAVYRMLNEIQKNEAASLGLNIKSGNAPTLGNLLHSSKYFARTQGGVNGYTDINITTNEGIERRTPSESAMHSLLGSTNQAPTETTIARIEALFKDNENVTPLMVNELTYNEMVLDSVTEKLDVDVFKKLLDTNADVWNEPLPNLLNQIDDLSARHEQNGMDANMERAKSILENVKTIINSNPSTVYFLESNNIPPSLVNIQAMTSLFKKSGYLGSGLNNISEKAEDSSLADSIPKSPLEYVGDDDTLKNSLNNISDNLGNLAFKDMDSEMMKEIKLLQNAIKVQSFVSSKQESYSIPIRLHDKITSLNMYIPRGKVPTDGNLTVAISIDTPKFGVVDSYIRAEGTNLSLYLNAKDSRTLDLLKDTKENLIAIFNESGFNLNRIIYNEEMENINDPYSSALKNTSNFNVKKHIFGLATNITKYLDKL